MCSLQVRRECSGRVSSKWLINRRALIRKKFRTAVSDVETIFQTNSKFAIDHDRGFITEAHAGLNRRFVATHKIRPFVAIEPDAMAGAMRQPRYLVIRTEPGIGDHFARGGVDGFPGRTDFRGGKTSIL